MRNDIDEALRLVKKIFAEDLEIVDTFDTLQNQRNIYLINPQRKKDRRHAHIAVVEEDGMVCIPYTRPYGEYRPPRRT